MASGELRPDLLVALVRDLVFGGIEHHVSPMLYGKGEVDARETTRLIMETLFDGLAGASRRTTPPLGNVLDRLESITSRLQSMAPAPGHRAGG